MWAAERPGIVQWNHPFLAPLKPLTPEAAHRIFIDIADDGQTREDVDNILVLANNIPLSIGLMAHLVAYEGVSNIFWNCLQSRDMARVTSNCANIEKILVAGLRQTGHGQIQAIHQLPGILLHLSDQRLEVYVLTRLSAGWKFRLISNVDHQVEQALEYFPQLDDSDLKCRFYDTIIHYYRFHNTDIRDGQSSGYEASYGPSYGSGYGKCGAVRIENPKKKVVALTTLADIKIQIGDYSAAQVHAYQAWLLARTCADLYGEADSLRTESHCWYWRGSYQHSISLCNKARDRLGLCGMSGGSLDQDVLNSMAEVHRLKSEYADARNIQTQILHNVLLSKPNSSSLCLAQHCRD
ncbi:hypothetical protein DFH09DRAFT_1102163 [Mycena vulgaris]|nr:hypothetical protein DFH09DRAFT_1102163 [Mycena vulgaris]